VPYWCRAFGRQRRRIIVTLTGTAFSAIVGQMLEPGIPCTGSCSGHARMCDPPHPLHLLFRRLWGHMLDPKHSRWCVTVLFL
jgi:hypothetical protein